MAKNKKTALAGAGDDDSSRFQDVLFTMPVVSPAQGRNIQIERWTPDIAMAKRSQVLPSPRGTNDLVVHQIKAAAAKGKFFADETVKVTTGGDIVDGQNVIAALIGMPAGSEVQIAVEYDVPDWYVPRNGVIKSKRTTGHGLKSFYGGEAITTLNTVASVSNMIHAYGGPGTLPDFTKKIWDFDDMLDFVRQWDVSLVWAANHGKKIASINEKRKGNITTADTLAFVLWLLRNEAGTVQFFEEMNRRSPVVMQNSSDPRTQLVTWYSNPVNENELILRWSNSYQVRLRRVVELLNVWAAFTSGTSWTAWDGMESTVSHPKVSKADAKKLGWA